MTTEENRKKQTEAAELDTLRAEIDRLDQELVERIHARSKVAMAIGEVKKRYSDSPVFLRPGREASMLRRAAEKHGDHPFPASSLLRIWREIIPAVTSLEGNLSLAIEEDEAAVAREHAQVHYAVSLERRHFPDRDAVAADLMDFRPGVSGHEDAADIGARGLGLKGGEHPGLVAWDAPDRAVDERQL